MLFGPARIVHVTTKAELDAALKTADKVIVDGDDQLLTYAVTQAAGDPLNDIAIQMNDDPLGLVDRGVTVIRRRPVVAAMPPPAPVASGVAGPLETTPPAATAAAITPKRSGWWMASTCLAVLAMLALGFVALHKDNAVPPSPVSTPAAGRQQPDRQAIIDSLSGAGTATAPRGIGPLAPSPGVPAAPKPAAPIPTPSQTSNVALVQAIAWPLVAVIAILALLLIARQAIAGGRNVEFSWKVTEKVSGRVVITKVKSPTARRPHGAPA